MLKKPLKKKSGKLSTNRYKPLQTSKVPILSLYWQTGSCEVTMLRHINRLEFGRLAHVILELDKSIFLNNPINLSGDFKRVLAWGIEG